MSRLRQDRFVVAGVGVSLLGFGLLLTAPAAGPAGQVKDVPKDAMKKAAPQADGGQADMGYTFTLPTDPKLKQRLQLAQDYMKEEDWPNVVRTLQGLLDPTREDAFVPVHRKRADGKEGTSWGGVRAEASYFIGTLPPKGMEFYKLTYNQPAADLLKQAKATGDAALLARVAHDYLHTDAGAEATELLGTRAMDRGQFVQAALCFERLMNRQGPDKLSPLTLFKAALAFHRAGDKTNEKVAWEQLATKSPDGLRLGGQAFALDTLRREVEQSLADPLQRLRSKHEWPEFGGDPGRNAQGEGGTPFLVQRWAMPTTHEKRDDKRAPLARRELESALQGLAMVKQPVLPTYYPLAVTAEVPGKGRVPLLVFRTHAGLHAVELKTGEIAWESNSYWSLEEMYNDSSKQGAVQSWITQYQRSVYRSVLLENSVLGMLSTDGQRVYAVDDFSVPPFVPQQVNFAPQPFAGGQEISERIHRNSLQAIALGSGKVLWEAGGPGDKGELADSYFLGPPLALGGKLYVLTDKNQEVRLVCLEPATGAVQWAQTLGSTKDKLLHDPLRRSRAALLAYGDGILVCPTNSSALVGVDLMTHSLLWAYYYRDRAAPAGPEAGMGAKGGMVAPPGVAMQQPNLGPLPSSWKVSAPIVLDGKVVFTAPDGTTIDCLNLKDSSRLWRHNRANGDLYLAGVYAGRVLIVGKDRCRALDLKDGSQVWSLETGQPAGRGVASDNVYYLPLKAAAAAPHGPEVCAIDVAKGEVVAHTKSRRGPDGKQEVPGNLLFYEGDVLSQSALEIVAYPQLTVKLREIDTALAKNPKDPVGLTDRGELLLDRGDRAGAVADLREALANSPPADLLPRTRLKLYEALTELLDSNFAAGEKYLADYEALCKIEPAADADQAARDAAAKEQRRRQVNYLYLVAKGREAQGRLVEALDAYQRFGGLADDDKQLISVVGEPAVKARPEVWAQGRISAMIANASPKDRQPLEQQVGKTWAEVKQSGDLNRLRKFVAVFGSFFSLGREARLELAERLLAENDKATLLEAESHLHLLRNQKDDRRVAARAVEALARLMTRHGQMDDAAFYFRVLGKDFADVVVRDGKTGAQLLDDLAADKRFLPFVEEPVSALPPGGKIDAKEEPNGPYQPNKQLLAFDPQGEVIPFFRRLRALLSVHEYKLMLQDARTGEESWGHALPRNHNLDQVLANYLYQVQLRLPLYTVGHLIVLPLGHMVYGVDPINRQVLWQESLLGTASPGQPMQFWTDPEGQHWAVYPDFKQKLGQVGLVEPSYVCLQTRDGLVTLDPVSGRRLWERGDVSPDGHLFGDAEYVFVVDVGQDGTTGGSRAFRGRDGAAVAVPDFAALYQKRVRTLGRLILVHDPTPAASTLRLYDPLAGKELWARKFKANSIMLKSEETDLAGVIEPDGQVTVVNLKTYKDELKASVDPAAVANAKSIHLLQDSQLFYMAVNGPVDPNNPVQGPWSAFLPGSGVRALPVNGRFYAFQKGTGELHWHSDLAHQMLLLDHARDLPFLLFATRYQKMGAGGFRGWQMQTGAVVSIEKRTGKRLYDNPELQNLQFYALNVDQRSGRIELLGSGLKIVHYLPGASKDKAGGKPQPGPQQGALTPRQGPFFPKAEAAPVIKR